MPIPVPTDKGAEDAAQTVQEALAAAGCAGRDVVLAIASASCLCAPLCWRDLPVKDRRKALLYRLEEKVPVCAEDVVADFVPASEGVLGVCAVRAEFAPLIEELERRAVPIAAVCPTSLLAMQFLLESQERAMPQQGQETQPNDAVVMGNDQGIEWVHLEDGRPCGWFVFSDDPGEILLHLKLESYNGRPPPRRLLAVGLAAGMSAALSAGLDAPLTDVAAFSVADGAARMAERILGGRSEPWVNLRGGFGEPHRLRPIRRPLRYAVAAVSLCLLSACAAMLWRAARYDRLAARYADEQHEIFRQEFPKQPEPLDVRSRLDSEERAIRGLSGDASATPPPRPPGLMLLRDVLAHLPGDIRFRVHELRLDGPKFAIEGQVRSHGDADAIAESLRGSGELSVDPPRTEQLSRPANGAAPGESAATSVAEKAVGFTLTGTIKPDGKAARKGTP